jgi:hypothetical protein
MQPGMLSRRAYPLPIRGARGPRPWDVGKKSKRQVWSSFRKAPRGRSKPTCTCNDGKLPGGEYCACKVGKLRRELDEHSAAELHYHPHGAMGAVGWEAGYWEAFRGVG